MSDVFKCKNKVWHFVKDKLIWTWQGTINKQATEEDLANETKLDTETRFQIAVMFCLEDHINSLSIARMPTDYLQNRDEILLTIAAMDAQCPSHCSTTFQHCRIYTVFSGEILPMFRKEHYT